MWILSILAAYLIGGVPFGVLIARSRGVNIRELGSKNIGATNVGRVLGKPLGILCFVLDLLKGALPVLCAGIIHGVVGHEPHELAAAQMWLWMAVAAAAVLGHMYSPYIGFAGGKGVATGFGAIIAMYPLLTWPAVAAIGLWCIVLRLSRYVSLSSMLAALSLPVTYLLSVTPALAQDQPIGATLNQLRHASPPLIGTAVIALLVIWKHRTNIRRLLQGDEPKVGRKDTGR